jgi:NAD(P)-dependent dehydrogenase (short-subunit alcohol dehydrogenase family)
VQKQNVALVTGSSSGIGYETSLLLAKSGYHTYASMRNLEKSKSLAEIAETEKLPLEIIQIDVNDDRSVKDAIDKIIAEGNGIDVLIEEIQAQFETNFFGVIRVTQRVLPIMRNQNSGTIVNLSSVGGRVGVPALSAYQSTKFALEGLSESLSYELEPFGIRVVIVEPGFVRTNIMNSSIVAKKAVDRESAYFSLMQKVENHFKSMMDNPSTSKPEEVANVILTAITSENPQLRYTAGNDAATVMQAKKTMSDSEFGNLIKQQFL